MSAYKLAYPFAVIPRLDRGIQSFQQHQRYLSRPRLEELFSETTITDKEKRNTAINRAVVSHGYSNRAVAEYLGMHYSTISRLLSSHEYQK